MVKSADAFRSIGEVARLIGVAPHVLRYWETQFPQLTPVKRADGRRYYRPDDVRLAAGLCEVMRDEGMTARGAARLIALDKGAALRARGAERVAAMLAAGEVEAPAPAKRARKPAAPRVKKPAPERPDSLPLFPEAAAAPKDRTAKPADGPAVNGAAAKTDSVSPSAPAAANPAPRQSHDTGLVIRLAAAEAGLRRLPKGAVPAADLAPLALRLRQFVDAHAAAAGSAARG